MTIIVYTGLKTTLLCSLSFNFQDDRIDIVVKICESSLRKLLFKKSVDNRPI